MCISFANQPYWLVFFRLLLVFRRAPAFANALFALIFLTEVPNFRLTEDLSSAEAALGSAAMELIDFRELGAGCILDT